MAGAPAPYWRLSGFYFFYFASLGALVPYWGLYLQSLDFSVVEIGQLMAVLMATKIVAPNIWGWIADHTGRRMPVVRMASLLSLLAFLGIFWSQTFLWLACLMALFSFFWNASLPQFEATTLNHLGSKLHHYARIRLWGSVGFIVTVIGVGPLLATYGIDRLPTVIALLFAGIFLVSWTVPEEGGGARRVGGGSLLTALRNRTTIALLVVCFLLQASHGAYYTFFSIYLEQSGYARGWIGGLWAWGVVAEIGVFLVMHRLMARWSAEHILFVSILLSVVRWVLIAYWVTWLPGLLLAQTLHAASFGTYHAAAIHLVHVHFHGRLQGRGQALYSSLSFGAGGALGAFASGYAWESLGAEWVFLLAAAVAALGALVSWRWLPADSHARTSPAASSDRSA